MKDKALKNMEIIFIVVAVVFVYAKIGSMDFEDQKIEREHYCQMVDLWNANKHLAPERRPGWPPYNGEEQCHED